MTSISVVSTVVSSNIYYGELNFIWPFLALQITVMHGALVRFSNCTIEAF